MHPVLLMVLAVPENGAEVFPQGIYYSLCRAGIVPLAEAIAGRSSVIVIAPCLAGGNYQTTQR